MFKFGLDNFLILGPVALLLFGIFLMVFSHLKESKKILSVAYTTYIFAFVLNSALLLFTSYQPEVVANSESSVVQSPVFLVVNSGLLFVLTIVSSLGLLDIYREIIPKTAYLKSAFFLSLIATCLFLGQAAFEEYQVTQKTISKDSKAEIDRARAQNQSESAPYQDSVQE